MRPGRRELLIEARCYEAMVAHVQRVYPEEGCGLLAGSPGRAHHHYPITNELRSASRFVMAAGEQIQAMVEMEQRGWELSAIYHSHPESEPYPSETDIAQAYYPDAVQIIISLQERRPAVAAFLIRQGEVSVVSVRLG